MHKSIDFFSSKETPTPISQLPSPHLKHNSNMYRVWLARLAWHSSTISNCIESFRLCAARERGLVSNELFSHWNFKLLLRSRYQKQSLMTRHSTTLSTPSTLLTRFSFRFFSFSSHQPKMRRKSPSIHVSRWWKIFKSNDPKWNNWWLLCFVFPFFSLCPAPKTLLPVSPESVFHFKFLTSRRNFLWPRKQSRKKSLLMMLAGDFYDSTTKWTLDFDLFGFDLGTRWSHSQSPSVEYRHGSADSIPNRMLLDRDT